MPPLKPFPLVGFAEALGLIKAILQHGVKGEIRRLRLFQEIDRSPSSGPSRQWIATAAKYGLVNVSAGSEMLSVTDDGRYILDHPDTAEGVRKKFEMSIENFDAFRMLYEKIKNHRVPEPAILQDELSRLNIPDNDLEAAAGIFIKNLDFNQLIADISGSRTIIPIDQLIEEKQYGVSSENQKVKEIDNLQHEGNADTPSTGPRKERREAMPSLHIDVQIHIDSSASADQIEQIFSNMAKHLYGRENA